MKIVIDRQERIEHFYRLAVERMNIHIRRFVDKQPAPYTTDEIFKAYRFCNVFREYDATTVWFAEKVRSVVTDPDQLVLATIAFRWFNRMSTGEALLPWLLGERHWNSDTILEKLRHLHPIVTGAYVIKTPDGFTKLQGILQCIDNVRKELKELTTYISSNNSIEKAHGRLTQIPYLGDFMAYQIVSDLMYTPLLQTAPDRMTWTCVGPGSARGCGWILENDPNHFSKDSKAQKADMVKLMREILGECDLFWPKEFKRWDMQTVQHWLCEYDKYLRAAGGQRLKRRFS